MAEKKDLHRVKLSDLKKKYAKQRTDHALSQLTDTSLLRKTRQAIAREYTVLREKMNKTPDKTVNKTVDKTSEKKS
ncbi:50S ribosomal protein L29 [Spirochaetota bacterium]|nr:50S ribosomal protein L29 [Spirochaetota bacterium]